MIGLKMLGQSWVCALQVGLDSGLFKQQKQILRQGRLRKTGEKQAVVPNPWSGVGVGLKALQQAGYLLDSGLHTKA